MMSLEDPALQIEEAYFIILTYNKKTTPNIVLIIIRKKYFWYNYHNDSLVDLIVGLTASVNNMTDSRCVVSTDLFQTYHVSININIQLQTFKHTEFIHSSLF